MKVFWNKSGEVIEHCKHYEDMVVVPYAGDIDPKFQDKFDNEQRKALDKLQSLEDDGYEIDERVIDQDLHVFVYIMRKVVVSYE